MRALCTCQRSILSLINIYSVWKKKRAKENQPKVCNEHTLKKIQSILDKTCLSPSWTHTHTCARAQTPIQCIYHYDFETETKKELLLLLRVPCNHHLKFHRMNVSLRATPSERHSRPLKLVSPAPPPAQQPTTSVAPTTRGPHTRWLGRSTRRHVYSTRPKSRALARSPVSLSLFLTLVSPRSPVVTIEAVRRERTTSDWRDSSKKQNSCHILHKTFKSHCYKVAKDATLNGSGNVVHTLLQETCTHALFRFL